jgi:hypothetical protein
MFTLCGDGLCVGRDSSDAVSSAYTSPGDLTGANVLQVEINLSDDQYIDLERRRWRRSLASSGHRRATESPWRQEHHPAVRAAVDACALEAG